MGYMDMAEKSSRFGKARKQDIGSPCDELLISKPLC
jgi:hypothetical protein